jgi:hypothetical protein
MPPKSITFIIPTLGERPESLLSSIDACLAVEHSFVRVVGPLIVAGMLENYPEHRVEYIQEIDCDGAAEALNFALGSDPIQSDFFTWIGDDDEVIPEGVRASIETLCRSNNCVATYGIVNYVDSSGNLIRVHRPPKNPRRSLKFGPQKIAQPGMVFRSRVLSEIGFLDTRYRCAWDQDFIYRCSSVGEITFVESKVANYMWHSGALTSSFLSLSLIESASIRAQAFPDTVARIWMTVEYFRIISALVIGTRMTNAGNWKVLKEVMKVTYSRAKGRS